jgi:hypothetical protein
MANRDGGKLKTQTTETALATLPAEFQKPVGWFYGFFREGLKGSASLAMRIRYWIESEGLTLDEAKQAMKALMTPARAGEITYGGNQLLAVLAQEVGTIVAERNRRVAAEERRREAAELEANRLAPEQVSKTLRTIKEMMADRTTMPPARDRSNDQRNNEFSRLAGQ